MVGYWEIPEGTDCVRKAWITGRIGAALGLVGSAYHIVLIQHESVFKGVQTAATGTVTMATLGAVFGLTTCLSAHVREDPEDALNYFIGGCASGIVLGVRNHSYATGSSACFMLGLLAAFTKIGKREGWTVFGPPRL
ncbi:NADH dehydrogenase [ubiquinone] 1 alpha subcomplex subunit 11 [Malaclemys terrapin pileata]|uniref:NADH dehydrogenase [ubiquinone] 1 alpha subcomplex subunit 11 n=1 Tax=Malaclemys terrapin pileata TaxID=2991368 RepID=UPI0023A85F8A|nr:NADH dehydrogenase [ubiquinone] 1 alpha subcomplex subunit 11 [Malaclemys terrapin pileata]